MERAVNLVSSTCRYQENTNDTINILGIPLYLTTFQCFLIVLHQRDPARIKLCEEFWIVHEPTKSPSSNLTAVLIASQYHLEPVCISSVERVISSLMLSYITMSLRFCYS